MSMKNTDVLKASADVREGGADVRADEGSGALGCNGLGRTGFADAGHRRTRSADTGHGHTRSGDACHALMGSGGTAFTGLPNEVLA